jgi:hypothetical protein
VFGKKKDGKPKRTKDDVWTDLAGRFGGEIIMDKKGKRLKGVRFSAGEWTVVMDAYVVSNGQTSQTYTRLRGLYTEKAPFQFRAYTKSVFSDIGKALGMQDIVVGHPMVDDRWIIKSDSEGLVRSLLILPEVASGFSHAKSARFQIRRHKRSLPGVQELRFMVLGITTDDRALDAFVAMMLACLAHFVRAGVAHPEPPDVSL